MKDAITLLSDMEQQCLPQDELLNNNVPFSSYIENREKTVLRKIIRSSRRKAYLISDLQVPLRVYANQLETVNSMLSAKKYLLAIPRKKVLQNRILSSMPGKVQLIISPLRLKGS